MFFVWKLYTCVCGILCETKGACCTGRPFLWEEVPPFILARVPTNQCESWPVLWVHMSSMFLCVCTLLPLHVMGGRPCLPAEVCFHLQLWLAAVQKRFVGDDDNVPCFWYVHLRTHYMRCQGIVKSFKLSWLRQSCNSGITWRTLISSNNTQYWVTQLLASIVQTWKDWFIHVHLSFFVS